MRRDLVIVFGFWFIACVIAPIGTSLYGSPLSLSWEHVQLGAIVTLIGISQFYIFYMLYKIKVSAAVIFMIAVSLLFLGARYFYVRYFPDMDLRVQFLQLLGLFVATAVIVHMIQRKRESQRHH